MGEEWELEVCTRSGQIPWECGLAACENGCETRTVTVMPVPPYPIMEEAHCQHCWCLADERSFMCEDHAGEADAEVQDLRDELALYKRDWTLCTRECTHRGPFRVHYRSGSEALIDTEGCAPASYALLDQAIVLKVTAPHV